MKKRFVSVLVTPLVLLTFFAFISFDTTKSSPNKINSSDQLNVDLKSSSAKTPLTHGAHVKASLKKSKTDFKDFNASDNLFLINKEYLDQNVAVNDQHSAAQYITNYLQAKFPKTFNISGSFLSHEKNKVDQLGNQVFRFGQVYQGVPVFAHQIALQVNKLGKPSLLYGVVTPNINVATTPKLQASEIVEKFASNRQINIENIEVYKAPKLQIYVDKNNKSSLVYNSVMRFHKSNKGMDVQEVFISANTGELVSSISRVHSSMEPDIYDYQGGCVSNEMMGRLSRSPQSSMIQEEILSELTQNQALDDEGDSAATAAYENYRMTYWFFKHMFGRDSYDNRGTKLPVVIHISVEKSNGPNAHPPSRMPPRRRPRGPMGPQRGPMYGPGPYGRPPMAGPRMMNTYPSRCSKNQIMFIPDLVLLLFGDGDGNKMRYPVKSLDIFSHEFTHSITWFESALVYRDASGAINESLSDIFSAGAEAFADSGGGEDGLPEGGLVANSKTWVLGEDTIDSSMLRHMNNPTQDRQSADDYRQARMGREDNGHVHSNSGIMNLSFYLLSEGGAHPRNNTDVEVNGIGIEKALQIYYHSSTNLFIKHTNFVMARDLLARSAEDLYGHCSEEWIAVHKSFDAVNVPGDWYCQ